MTSVHARALRRLHGDGNVRMYRSFDPAAPVVTPERADRDEHLLDIDDPWYGPEAGFERTLASVEAAIPGLLDHLDGR